MENEGAAGLKRREGYWQHELMTLLPWGLNTRDELNGGVDSGVDNSKKLISRENSRKKEKNKNKK